MHVRDAGVTALMLRRLRTARVGLLSILDKETGCASCGQSLLILYADLPETTTFLTFLEMSI